MKIKAYATKEKGGKTEVFYYDREVGALDALVRITHCSITRGDVQFMNDDWNDASFPLVAGHEIIGIVEAIGAGVTKLRPGDRVGIGYQQSACFECEYCKSGHEQFCADQKNIVVHCYGGLADHIITDHRFVFKIPDNLDSANSAPLLSSGVTVYTAIKTASLSDKAVTGVIGVGGLGLLATRFLDKMGHNVYAFSQSPGKKALVEQTAAFVDSSRQENLSSLHRQFDFLLSTVNANFDLDSYLKLLKPQGKLCLVASPLQKASVSLGILYDYAQRTIYGNFVGSRQNMKDMLAFAAKQHIDTMVEVKPFSELNEAIELLRNTTLPTRLVMENNG